MSDLKVATYNVPKPDGILKLAKSKDVAVKVANMRSLIKVKTTGELKGKAFYLPKAYKWIHAFDVDGNEVLIPRAIKS
jgi:hypothetical protein